MKNKRWFLWILLLAATFALMAGGCGGGSGGSGSGGGVGDTPEVGENPSPTLPDPDTDTWDGTIDTSWFVNDDRPRSYQIKTGAQLAGLADLVNRADRFAGSTFILTNNIDLASRDWTPIGSYDYFMGTFDGGGHTISNMRTERRDYYTGLFGRISGTIKDVHLSNIYSAYENEGIGCTGGLVGYNTGTITGCASSGSVYSFGAVQSSAGGLVGYNTGTITDCASNGSVTSNAATYAYAGGLVGWNTGTITGCASSGSVESFSRYYSSSSYAGGLVGWNDGGRIEDCASKAERVSAYAVGGGSRYRGGFIGYVKDGTLTNNRNETGITPAIGRDMRKNPAGPSEDI